MELYIWNFSLREGASITYYPWIPPGVELQNYKLYMEDGAAYMCLSVRTADSKWAKENGLIPVKLPHEPL